MEDLGVFGDADDTKESLFESNIVPVAFTDLPSLPLLAPLIILLLEATLANDELDNEDEDETGPGLLPDTDLILILLPRFLLPSNDPLIAKNSPILCPIFPPLLLWWLSELIFLLLPPPPWALSILLELLKLSPLPLTLLLVEVRRLIVVLVLLVTAAAAE
jgi:hypothetical protein